MRIIGTTGDKAWRKDWRAIDCVLAGYTVFIPLINLLWSVGYWLTRPANPTTASRGFTLVVNSDACLVATILLAVVWFGIKGGYAWGYAAHAAMGAWIVLSNQTFGLFSSFASVIGRNVTWNPYFADHAILRLSFLAVSLYCVTRLIILLLVHSARTKNFYALRGG